MSHRRPVALNPEIERHLSPKAARQIMLTLFDTISPHARRCTIVFSPEEDPDLAAALRAFEDQVVWKPYTVPWPNWMRRGWGCVLAPWIRLGLIHPTPSVHVEAQLAPELLPVLRESLDTCRLRHLHLWDDTSTPLWASWDCGATWFAFLTSEEFQELNRQLSERWHSPSAMLVWETEDVRAYLANEGLTDSH